MPKTPQLCPPSERAQHACPALTQPPEIVAERSPSAARHSAQPHLPVALSSDEAALMQTMAAIAARYFDADDVTSRAYLELLEALGPVFPLASLWSQAKRIYERDRAQLRRNHAHATKLPQAVPQWSDDETGTPEMVLPDARTPEVVAVLREQLRTLERDERGRLLVKRELDGRLSSTDRTRLQTSRKGATPRRKWSGGRRKRLRRILIYGRSRLGTLGAF